MLYLNYKDHLDPLSHVCKKVRLQQHLMFDNRKTDLQMNDSDAYIPSVTYIVLSYHDTHHQWLKYTKPNCLRE